MFEKYPDIVTPEQITEMLGISKTKTYALLRDNEIRHVKIGKKYIVPKTAILSFIGELCYNNKQIDSGLQLVTRGDNEL